MMYLENFSIIEVVPDMLLLCTNNSYESNALNSSFNISDYGICPYSNVGVDDDAETGFLYKISWQMGES